MAPSAPSPSQSPPATAPPPQSPPSPPPPKKSPPPPKSSPPSPPPKSGASPPSPSKDGGDDDSSSSPPPPETSTVIPSQSPPPPLAKSTVAPSSNNNYSSSEKSPSPSGPNASLVIIVGVAAGAALLLIIMTLLFLACSRKKKKQKQNINTYYGGDGPSPDSKVGKEYYMYTKPPFQQQQNNWVKATPDHNNVIKIQKTPSSHQLSLTTTSQTAGLSAPPIPSASSGEVISTATGAASHHHHHHHHHHRSSSSMAPNYNLGKSQSRFSYEELAAATGDFAETNILGQGGFGHVFKGVLPDGKEVAVKTLKSESGQGDREFQAEVDIITRVHHRHLVSLVGYCIDGPKKILVYEFVPNKTLEYHLHANDRPVMDWPTRIKIALGSAKGIAYLHEDCHPRIIHRDIKASNILLEYNFEAKVSDFGLAKLTSDNNTHVSTRVMGTFGYLAPEYASSGKLTEKSDTFSFGVMLLELITGRRPVDSSSNDMMEDSLVEWARPLIDHALATGDYSQLVDPRLQGNYVPQELASMVACAAACTRHSARRRPKMIQVVRALEGDLSLDVINSWNKQKQEGSSGDYGATSSYSSTD